jgi:hypothetical protein
MAVPNLDRVATRTAELQAWRRQLLVAIAAERYLSARGELPASADLLVPKYLENIPGDPCAPWKPLQYEVGRDGERHRIESVSEERPLVFPEAF